MKAGLSILLLLATASAIAQKKQIDISSAIGNYEGSLSAMYTYAWRLGAKKKFEFGIGARFTSYVGQNQYYITAPAKLTSGSTGPLVIFKENIAANIDTFLIQSPQVNALNAAIHLGYQINSRLAIGFNIDAIGLSIGTEKSGSYINGVFGQQERAKPTLFNLLLISDNDLGTLNSELFLKYQWKETWGVKGGLQFLFTEYTTHTNVQQVPEPNNRFRDKSLLFAFGVYKNL
ncbi:MAG: hypothetical protein KF763_19575 [Cyclobacteriaceae bacterium]|nr:hypothetical protein [Cyclobacteriaceae bacterium]